MIIFSQLAKNFDRINFDKIVTDASMREYLGYDIPEGRVLLDWKGRIKKASDRAPPTRTIPKRVLGRRAPSKKNAGKPSKAAPKRDAPNKGKGKMPEASTWPNLEPVVEVVYEAIAAPGLSSENHPSAVQSDPGMP